MTLRLKSRSSRSARGISPITSAWWFTWTKASQKQLLIGKGGAALKEVGMQARPAIEALTGRPAYLELWVKVNLKWRRKAGFIQRTL